MPGFDGANQIEIQNSSIPTASTFTPSGSNDISVQACASNTSGCNSVSAPFLGDNLGGALAWAHLNSPTNWTAPTWTLASVGVSQLTQMEFGFDVKPCGNTMFIDFGGPDGSAPVILHRWRYRADPSGRGVGAGWAKGDWTGSIVQVPNSPNARAHSGPAGERGGKLCRVDCFSETPQRGFAPAWLRSSTAHAARVGAVVPVEEATAPALLGGGATCWSRARMSSRRAKPSC